MLDRNQLYELLPQARSSTGRALWSPNTVVVKPLCIINKLRLELESKGVRFFLSQNNWSVDSSKREITLKDNTVLGYKYLFNSIELVIYFDSMRSSVVWIAVI